LPRLGRHCLSLQPGQVYKMTSTQRDLTAWRHCPANPPCSSPAQSHRPFPPGSVFSGSVVRASEPGDGPRASELLPSPSVICCSHRSRCRLCPAALTLAILPPLPPSSWDYRGVHPPLA
jgi:hypothetical protein